MRHDFWASIFAHNLVTPCLGHEPKARVTTFDESFYGFAIHPQFIQEILDFKSWVLGYLKIDWDDPKVLIGHINMH
jgi:hypothetical protein